MKRKAYVLKRKKLAAAISSITAPVLGLSPTSGQAQQDIIEEVIVTATRRETTVQDIPFNIAAFSGETLERQRLTRLTDFGRWVPGLTVVDQGPRASDRMTVRGLNVESINDSEFLDNTSGDTVATYIGEIPFYVDLKMRDLERVEVLIGPQGTLYGAGTLGGAIRYIPRAPDMSEFTLDVHGDLFSVAHSDDFGTEVDAVVNVPIIEDRLAFRGSIGYLDSPGFIDYPFLLREPGISDPEPDFNDPAAVAANLRNVEDADYEETLYGRFALAWDLSDRVNATFNYYYQDQEVGSRTINHRQSFGTGEYVSAHRFLEPSDRENELFSVELVADLGFAELTSATGFSEFNRTGQRDQTDLLLDFQVGYETFPLFAAFTRESANEERLNQELRLVSTGSERWNWIAGFFHNELDSESISEEFAPGFPQFAGINRPDNLEFIQVTDQDQTEQAFFGEISYQVNDQWQITVGGRRFEYDDDTLTGFDLPLFNGTPDQVLLALDRVTFEDDGFIGKFNTSYTFNDDVTGYLTISEGYRIGGANAVPPCQSPLPPGQNVCALPDEVLVDPDTTTNFEVGVHSTWRDGALTLNGAIYTIDWDEIQTASTTVNGAIPIVVNGGSARSRGLELAVQARLASNWDISATYAFSDAELTSDAPGLVDGADAFDGDRLAGTPEHQASVYVSYFRTLNNGWDLDVDYGFTVTSDVLTKVGLRNDGEILGGYTVHNASVGVSRDRWSAVLYADNLTDKFAETGVKLDPSWIRSVGGFTLRRFYKNVLTPRTIGIEFRYRL